MGEILRLSVRDQRYVFRPDPPVSGYYNPWLNRDDVSRRRMQSDVRLALGNS